MKNYSMNYVVDYRDVDQYFDLTAESLMKILGTVSMNHEILGYQLKPGYMGKWGMAWILYQWKIFLDEPKQYARYLQFKTAAVVQRGIYCYRYYHISDMEGNFIGTALSHWVAVDMEKRKIAKIPEAIKTLLESGGDLLPELAAVEAQMDLRPIRKQEEALDFQWTIPVLYSDVDSNGHVNNAVYGRWAVETIHAYDPKFLHNHYHKEIQVVYKKEKQPDGEVHSHLRLTNDRSYHEILDESGQLLTLIEMGWGDKQQDTGDYEDYDISAIAQVKSTP